MKNKIFSGLVFAFYAICMCTHAFATELQSKTETVNYNDMARYLAGIQLEQQSSLYPLTQKKFFREHSAMMERFWSEVLRENVFNIIPWRNSHLMPHYDYGTAFYPLSGGDFINFYLFYPLAKKYIMVSLEEAGRLPKLNSLKDHELQSGLRSLRNAIGNIAKKNYMMSAIMKHEMKNPFLEGTLPTILVFAARMELDIRRIEPVMLTARGTLVSAADLSLSKDEAVATGNRIVFKASPTGPERELIYLSMRLRHDSFDPVAPGGKFFSDLRDLNVIIKSAFYLLHRASFGRFCTSLLERTRLLIQDDSGLPYSFFDNSSWNTFLFGHYTHPLALRDMKHPVDQPELAREFKNKAQPLPFNFGYGTWRTDKKSNLIMAVRKSKKSNQK